MEELRCLLDVPGLRISYDEANCWLYNQWLGVHDAASVQEHAALICAQHRAYPCSKILSDHTGLAGGWQHSVPWIGGEYLSTLAEQGVEYLAWVYSKHYQDHTSMQQALYYATRPVIAIFEDVASAYYWLQHCPAFPAAWRPDGKAAAPRPSAAPRQ